MDVFNNILTEILGDRQPTVTNLSPRYTNPSEQTYILSEQFWGNNHIRQQLVTHLQLSNLEKRLDIVHNSLDSERHTRKVDMP